MLTRPQVRIAISVANVEQDATKLMEEIANKEAKVEKWMAAANARKIFSLEESRKGRRSPLTSSQN